MYGNIKGQHSQYLNCTSVANITKLYQTFYVSRKCYQIFNVHWAWVHDDTTRDWRLHCNLFSGQKYILQGSIHSDSGYGVLLITAPGHNWSNFYMAEQPTGKAKFWGGSFTPSSAVGEHILTLHLSNYSDLVDRCTISFSMYFGFFFLLLFKNHWINKSHSELLSMLNVSFNSSKRWLVTILRPHGQGVD